MGYFFAMVLLGVLVIVYKTYPCRIDYPLIMHRQTLLLLLRIFGLFGIAILY